jgi:hypothetical protein
MAALEQVTDLAARLPGKKRDSAALALLTAMGLALAVTGGAALSGMASGALRTALSVIDFGSHARQVKEALEQEQHRQAYAIGKLEDALNNVTDRVAVLNSRVETSRGAALRAAIDKLNAGLARDGIDIGALRSSLNEQERSHREEVAAINKRIGRLESFMSGHDLTGAIRPRPGRQRVQRGVSGWAVDWATADSAVISGQGGTFAVAPGTIVPGLGRIAELRQRGDRWVVLTDKGAIVQR